MNLNEYLDAYTTMISLRGLTDHTVKSYKTYIGTELLHKLMNHLIESGCSVVRYSISVEHWAYQIYENLGFEIESRDMETINFVRRIGQ